MDEVLPPMSFRIESPMQLQIAVMNTRASAILKVFSVIDQTLIATAVSELGSNILKYGGGKGTLTISQAVRDGEIGVTVVALDQGSGIPDIEQALQDSFSSSGTLGLGLPSVKRIMTTLDIETGAKGTRITASKYMPQRKNAVVSPKITTVFAPIIRPAVSISLPIEIEFFSQIRPFPGECFSGDFTFAEQVGDKLFFGVIDISGHGYQAYQLGRAFADMLEDMTFTDKCDLTLLITHLHKMAIGTRGAAVGFAVLDTSDGRLEFSGVGNVHLRCYGTTPWNCISRDGILGERLGSLQTQFQNVEAGCLLVMASDGVSERSSAVEMQSCIRLPIEQITRRIIQKAGRMSDDASCVVVKCEN
jgi:anti-sigma regulatory factor (Ser/Thr protein kinase)